MTEIEMRDGLLRDLQREVHDMCQPLTLLQGRLELGRMCGDPASLLAAVNGGLEETERMVASIGAMRELLEQYSEEKD